MPIIMAANRFTRASNAGPAAICQMLVIRVGITRIAAASAGGIAMERSPMATVGNPMPTTPLTKPASKNVSATTTTKNAASDICSCSPPPFVEHVRDKGRKGNDAEHRGRHVRAQVEADAKEQQTVLRRTEEH